MSSVVSFWCMLKELGNSFLNSIRGRKQNALIFTKDST